MNNYLPTVYQQFIHKSRYARWDESLGRREEWDETVARYFNFFVEHLKDKYDYSVPLEQRQWLEGMVLNLKTMPSMRAIMTAGPALKRENMAGFNCSYLLIDNYRAFDEVLYILMNGTGVGFSVEQKYVQKLPLVPDELHPTDTIIVVADSKIGWASALRELVALLYAGKLPGWDTSKVRPAGARLKTFGGRASGPEPLQSLFNFVVEVFSKAKGRRLTTLECHDIVCKVAEIVVVGGVRRAALASLGDLNDDLMRRAKVGQWWIDNPQRALANDSWVALQKPSMDVFFPEWYSLYESKAGERGVFSRYGAIKHISKSGRRELEHEFGSNPCVTGDTPLLTDKGYFPISQLVGQEVSIWNGYQWSKVTPFRTGVNPVLLLKFSDGSSLRCTHYHKFILAGGTRVCADELIIGDRLEKFSMPISELGTEYNIDAYSQGFYAGDGNENYHFSSLYSTKYMCKKRLIGTFSEEKEDKNHISWKHGDMFPKFFVPINGALAFRLNWLAGLCDSDGTVTRDANGNGLQIGSINLKFLQKVRLMLTRMGVRAKIVSGNEEGYRKLPDGKGGSAEYFCQTSYRLLIGNEDTYTLKSLGFITERLQIHSNRPQRDARRFIRVTDIIDLGVSRKTFCVTEPLTHSMTVNGIVTGNCFEILLRPMQTCNLSEVIMRAGDTQTDLLEKVEAAAILGTWQSTLDDFRFVRKQWSINQQEERLLGVSLTGLYDWWPDNDITQLGYLKDVAIAANKEEANKLGINPSTAITCVKPSGTVSQLVNSASGMHPRHSEYYVRTVRGDKKDPLTRFLIDQGIPCENDLMQPQSTVVFSFPIKSPDGALCRRHLTAVEQLENYRDIQNYYCEHKPSVTINVKDHEWLEVGSWVFDNIDDVIGVSFLPDAEHSYKQAPYQDCSKEEYELLNKQMPQTIDWAKLQDYEKEDNTIASQELACAAGFCEIV